MDRKRFVERYAALKWIAAPLALVGVIFGFFALAWTEIPQAIVAVALFGLAGSIWVAFSRR